MVPMTWIKIACLAAIASVGAIAWIVIPVPAWTSAAFGAVVLLAGLVGAIFWFPLGNRSTKGSDAATLASIGPISSALGLLIPWAAAAVLVALAGHSTAAWVMNVLTLGFLVVAFSLLKATLSVVNRVSGGSTGPSNRTVWIAQIESLDLGAADQNTRDQVHRLVERLRYGASEIPGKVSDESPAIEQGIEALATALGEGQGDHALKRIAALDMLISNRDAGLRAARSKA